MNRNNIQFLLGIDGGGTKTEFLLTDSKGSEISRIRCGSSNPVNLGIDNTFRILSDGIMQICKDSDKSLISVFAGIAGAKTGENKSLINDFLSQSGFGKYACGSDIDLALELALGEKDGTVVIIGTGVVGLARKGEKLYRIGGRGYMIDKGGSGFCFGSDALNAAFESLDGREKSKEFLLLVENKLGKTLDKAVQDIYRGGPAFVASFAPVVFDAYKLNNETAAEIIDRNAKEIAKIINAALYNTGKCSQKTVICGGLSSQKEILYPFIAKYLEYDTEISFNDEPMVNAAVALAKKQLEM